MGGNKHATLDGRLVDAFNNGIAGSPMVFSVIQGTGTTTRIDSLTDSNGLARADFLSPRAPEMGRVRASASGLTADLDLQTAFVDPNAAGGYVSNYPNPFHPPLESTKIAYKLDDYASVTLRIFTLNGNLVLQQQFSSGDPGGRPGLNEYSWDGKNGEGHVVASGGYIALIEAKGTGETLHVIRHKIAVVR